MTGVRDVPSELRKPFKSEEVGKLPRVTCGNCSDKRKTCSEHKKEWCDVCKSNISVKHIHIDYVGHADVTSRLLEVDPEWSWEPQDRDVDPAVMAAALATGNPDVIKTVLENSPPKFALDRDGDPVGLWIRLTVGGITRPGYGSVPSGQNDAVKVLIGDAIRNASMRFGVALDLWAKGERGAPDTSLTAPAGRARQRPPQRESFEEARPPEHSADVDDGDWGDWQTAIEGITAREEAEKLDADLRKVFTDGLMGPTKAKNIRAAIKARADSLGSGTAGPDLDAEAQRLAAEAARCTDAKKLRGFHQEAMKAGKLPSSVQVGDYQGTLLGFITARKAELEASAASGQAAGQ